MPHPEHLCRFENLAISRFPLLLDKSGDEKKGAHRHGPDTRQGNSIAKLLEESSLSKTSSLDTLRKNIQREQNALVELFKSEQFNATDAAEKLTGSAAFRALLQASLPSAGRFGKLAMGVLAAGAMVRTCRPSKSTSIESEPVGATDEKDGLAPKIKHHFNQPLRALPSGTWSGALAPDSRTDNAGSQLPELEICPSDQLSPNVQGIFGLNNKPIANPNVNIATGWGSINGSRLLEAVEKKL